MQSVYMAAGGDEGLLRLAAAWHGRVMADEVVSHAFSHGFHPRHTERLAAYWAEALGGPTAFSDTDSDSDSDSDDDETSVVRMHSGNGQHEEMDRRAIACFDQALTDIGEDEHSQLRHVLHDYFAWATTTTMSRYHHSADDVPQGLKIPHWSWNGLQDGAAVTGPLAGGRDVRCKPALNAAIDNYVIKPTVASGDLGAPATGLVHCRLLTSTGGESTRAAKRG